MRYAVVASYAVVCLTHAWHGAVVTYQPAAACTAELAIIRIAHRRHQFLCQAVVVVGEDYGYVQSVRAGHAVVTCGARHSFHAGYLFSQTHEHNVLLGGDRPQWRVCPAVLLQVLDVRHAAQYGQYAFGCAGVAERPFGRRGVDIHLFHLMHDGRRLLGKSSAQQRLHHIGRYAAFVQLVVQVRRIGVTRIDLVGIVPIDVVEFDQHKIPVVLTLVVPAQQHVEDPHITVVRESQVTYPSFLLLLHEPIEYAVVDVPAVERRQRVTSAAYCVHKQVIDIIGLQVLQRPFEHRLRLFAFPTVRTEVRQLGGQVVTAARMPTQGYACHFLRIALAVRGRGVEEVHAVRQRIIDHLVHRLLVDRRIGVFTFRAAGFYRQTHHAESEQRHLVACVWVRAVCHLAIYHLTIYHLVIYCLTICYMILFTVLAGGNQYRCPCHSGCTMLDKLSSVHIL